MHDAHRGGTTPGVLCDGIDSGTALHTRLIYLIGTLDHQL